MPSGHGPDPGNRTPLAQVPGMVFMRPVAEGRANVEIGEYTYFDSDGSPERFFDENVLYHFDFVGDRLIIGKFCMIARGVRFVMNGGTHATSGFSTYPFNVFGEGWDAGFDPSTWEKENRGDTRLDHDIWLGRDATVMPGIHIGSGAIVAACSVVTKDVPPYAIVAGNPARVVRMRFDEETVARLLDIAWWDWDAARITRNLDAIRGADLDLLAAAR